MMNFQPHGYTLTFKDGILYSLKVFDHGNCVELTLHYEENVELASYKDQHG